MRRQLPAYSPIPPRALLLGGLALARSAAAPRNVKERLRETYGARGVLLVDSGTSALRLGLWAAEGSLKRPRVALPAFGCYDLATAARGAGARVAFYDLQPETLAPDPASLRKALDAGVRVVVVAHLYGVPVEMDAVLAACREAGALVLEDAAQGVGARYRDRPLGSFGSLSVLSFGRGKGRTGGGGGALLAHDERGEAALSRIGRLPKGGRGVGCLLVTAAQWVFGRPPLYALPAAIPFLRLGETTYRAPHVPSEMSAACAGVLVGTWDASGREAELRRVRAVRLLEVIRAVPDVTAIRTSAVGMAGFLRLPVLARSRAARNRLADPAARRLGIMPGYPRTLRELPGFGCDSFGDAGRRTENSFPGARELSRNLFTLPVHSRVSERDMRQIREFLLGPPG